MIMLLYMVILDILIRFKILLIDVLNGIELLVLIIFCYLLVITHH